MGAGEMRVLRKYDGMRRRVTTVSADGQIGKS